MIKKYNFSIYLGELYIFKLGIHKVTNNVFYEHSLIIRINEIKLTVNEINDLCERPDVGIMLVHIAISEKIYICTKQYSCNYINYIQTCDISTVRSETCCDKSL